MLYYGVSYCAAGMLGCGRLGMMRWGTVQVCRGMVWLDMVRWGTVHCGGMVG